MSQDCKVLVRPLARTLALCLALGLPVAAAPQETTGNSGTLSEGEAFLVADFMGLPLPALFISVAGVLELASSDVAGHTERAIFESTSSQSLAVVEADMFVDPENARDAYHSWTAEPVANSDLILIESAWVSIDDPNTSIRCWHEPARPNSPPDRIDCLSWTDGRKQLVGVRVEGAYLDNPEKAQSLLRQMHDMLRIAWYTAEHMAL